MVKLRIMKIIKLITFLLLISSSACKKKIEVDLISHNGAIYSLDDNNNIYEAVAVKNGKIIALGKNELSPLPAGPWWIYTGGVIGVIYIAFTSTIVQHLGVLTFTLFSVGGQLAASLIIDLVSPTDGVSVSAYLLTGLAMTYVGVIAGGVGNSRVQKPKRR